jgi:hypothetical protein
MNLKKIIREEIDDFDWLKGDYITTFTWGDLIEPLIGPYWLHIGDYMNPDEKLLYKDQNHMSGVVMDINLDKGYYLIAPVYTPTGEILNSVYMPIDVIDEQFTDYDALHESKKSK